MPRVPPWRGVSMAGDACRRGPAEKASGQPTLSVSLDGRRGCQRGGRARRCQVPAFRPFLLAPSHLGHCFWKRVINKTIIKVLLVINKQLKYSSNIILRINEAVISGLVFSCNFVIYGEKSRITSFLSLGKLGLQVTFVMTGGGRRPSCGAGLRA